MANDLRIEIVRADRFQRDEQGRGYYLESEYLVWEGETLVAVREDAEQAAAVVARSA